MAKLILISVILATIAIPLIAARDPSAVRGMKRAMLYTFLFNIAYLLGMLLIYPRVL